MIQDHLRPNEYDGIGNMCEIRAIGFLTYVADNRWYRNGKEDEWYQIPKQSVNLSTIDLYREYLNTLTTK